MTPLRQRLIVEIELRGLSPHTKDSYLRWVADLAKFRNASPEQITDEQVREYLLHLLHQRRLSPGSLIVDRLLNRCDSFECLVDHPAEAAAVIYYRRLYTAP